MLSVGPRQAPPSSNYLWDAGQLLSSNSSLKVRHTVVIANLVVALEDDLSSAVSDSVRNRHSMLTPKPKLSVEIGIIFRKHAAIARGHHLSRVKGKSSDISVRPADFLPATIPKNFT